MIPRTYPSIEAVNKQRQIIGFYLTSVTGLTKWVDYIPVKLVQSEPAKENSYNNDGYVPVLSLSSVTGLVPFKDYVPMFVDNSATDAWATSIAGYIPTGLSGFGGATLGLDFTTTETLDPRITFTRATTATRYNSQGLLEVVSAGQARFDYNPVTKAPRGLLIEEQRTNLLLQSETFATTWSSAASTVTSNTVVAPDGTLTGDKLVEDTTTAGHFVTQSFAGFTSGTQYTSSVYVKAGERTSFQLLMTSAAFGANVIGAFDLVNGVTTSSGGTNRSSSITPVGNGWYRCVLSAQATATALASVQIRVADSYLASSPSSYAGNGYSGIYIWGAQLEAGAFPTSYIPTVAAQVTRAADSASMTGTNFSSWYRADEGTIYGEYTGVANVSGGTRRLVEIGVSGSTAERLVAGYGATSSARWLVTSGSATQADITPLVTQGSSVKFAGAYAVNNFRAAANAVLGTADTAGVVPTVNAMFIGADFSNTANTALNGHIRKIAFYPRRLANSELQALTS